MKKFMLFAAMASVVLTSCVNEDKEAMESASKKAISFDTPVMKPTRAELGEIIGTTYPEAEKFKVYCKSYTGAYAGWEAAADYFDPAGVLVSKNGTQWNTTPTTYYWPELGNDLVFAAYSPADAAGDYTQTDAGLQIVGFTTAAANNQYDLMYTPRVNGRNKGNNGNDAVDMEFKHALTSVVFSAIATDDKATYKIKSLTVKGNLVTSGDFNQNITSATALDGTPKWTNKGTSTVSYEILSGAAVSVDNSGVVMLTGKDSDADVKSALLLIPQAVKGTVTIVYDKTTGSKTLESTATINLFDFKEGGADVNKWDMGNRYIYNITFGANKPIHFDPEVEANWNDVDLNYTIE